MMKSRKILRIAAVLALVTLTVFSMVACKDSGKDSGNDKSASDQKSEQSAVLYTVNGVDVTKAEVEMVGETPNLQIIFSNSTDKDVDVDFSQLSIKLADGTEVKNLGLTRTIEANKTYSQHAVSIEQKYGIKLGDTVEIDYGNDLINTSTVAEF